MQANSSPWSCNQLAYRAATNLDAIARPPYRPQLRCRYKINIRSQPTVRASLRADKQALVEELLQAVQQVQQHKHHDELLRRAHQLIEKGVEILINSPEWPRLAQAFNDAAQQQSTTAACVPRGQQRQHMLSGPSLWYGNASAWGMALRQPEGKQPQTAVQGSSSSSDPAAVQQQGFSSSPAERGAQRSPTSHSSSSWGFALRQPKMQEATAGASGPAQGSLAETDALSLSYKQQQAAVVPHLWEWSLVEQFMVLGLGSIGQCIKAPLTGVPSRLGFRLFQLILATALCRFMLPGLSNPPTAYDPEFDDFDKALLNSLGFKVLAEEPSHAVTCKTLMYMPCCPRQLYGAVLEANRRAGSLQHLAIFGTSMRSLADSQALLEALTVEATSAAKPAGTHHALSSHQAAQNTDSAVTLKLYNNTAKEDGPCSPLPDAAAASTVDVMQQAYLNGLVCEVLAPDCAAHGVGVAVHLFPSQCHCQ